MLIMIPGGGVVVVADNVVSADGVGADVVKKQ